MELLSFKTPEIAHFAYLLSDGHNAALIDPRRDTQEYLKAARERGVQIRYIFETHRQEDFVMGSTFLAQQTGAQIVNGTHELFGHGDLRLEDGEHVTLGSLKLRALHTPGHTPESMCYAIYESEGNKPAWGVFTGDTLFFGTTGRTDLTDQNKSVENAAILYDSVHSKLSGLGDTALILPAHGPGSVCGSGMASRPSSTLGVEKKENDVFTLSRQEFANKKGSEQLSRPPFFRHMEKVNLEGGIAPVNSTGTIQIVDVDTIREKNKETLVYDTREPEAYAGGHVSDSYSIWLGGLPVFGGWVADKNSEIYLITDRESDIDTAVTYLSRIGIDNVKGALAGGFGNWRKSGAPISTSGTISAQELKDDPLSFQILDVREKDEFIKGHIPGSENIFVGHLLHKLDELDFDKSRPVIVTCGVGHRAGLGVSILRRGGYKDVRNLLGGMSAWNQLNLATIQ
ncbi:MAG: MBL fold metallo-hydrolase [Ketobacter sp.]|nr:MAG: MBL fold metallo-hydrolase [Ketobacter sp.]